MLDKVYVDRLLTPTSLHCSLMLSFASTQLRCRVLRGGYPGEAFSGHGACSDKKSGRGGEKAPSDPENAIAFDGRGSSDEVLLATEAFAASRGIHAGGLDPF